MIACNLCFVGKPEQPSGVHDPAHVRAHDEAHVGLNNTELKDTKYLQQKANESS